MHKESTTTLQTGTNHVSQDGNSSRSPVKAFINVDRERVSILKNGSRTGYFVEPQSDKCSRMCGTPVLSLGVVRSAALTAQQQHRVTHITA